MCGIVGVIDLKHQTDHEKIIKMTETLKHRGPDGEGYLIGDISGDYEIWNSAHTVRPTAGNIALGHRRLSIIDISTGHQPMVNEHKNIAIVFNGEIYNFKELRQQLQSRGHRFSSHHSDTETIIHAYEEWGTSCLERLRGMFAFAIVDLVKNRLFLARDRLGKKPLYYYREKDKIVFASEIKAILADSRIRPDLLPSSLVEYLALGYILSPKTIYNNIYKLRPGHSLMLPFDKSLLDAGQECYWSVSYEPDYSRTEDDWLEELEQELTEAVRLRMISDAPLGAFLSGGIDSTAIVALMSSIHNEKIKTFSIGFEEKKYSETSYARQAAKKYGADYHEQIVRPDALDLLPFLAWQYDEPLGDSSVIPTYYVSKMAKEQVTVALSGDGGDEVFAGYQRYSNALNQGIVDRLPGYVRSGLKPVSSLYPVWLPGKGFLTRLSLNERDRYLQAITSPTYKQLLDPVLIGDSSRHPLKDIWGHEHCDYLSQMQSLDMRSYLPDNILVKVDRASMLCSLETRAPLLDHKVVELLNRVTANLKIKTGSKKYLLKKIIANDWGAGFLERPKMGFGVPLEYWFKAGDFQRVLEETILSDQSFISNYVSKKHVKSLVKVHLSGIRDFSVDIWRLLFLETWAGVWKPGSP